ncbi:hypothetical protein BC939DRAFT_451776 [Gamsiella multidivaricata]|uniref:uncharacterized protein n=1 Tax=Gamsiella multidivaricata TaxID=101098 RepID=UPI002220B62C|nr:uncharacterized protein BC939DRAFT_451776 [Gamsiella multidivaricata]KAI7823352.1 hypothetical protein BC939DRAFT_451776 [Gamsiella multidivaricata]
MLDHTSHPFRLFLAISKKPLLAHAIHLFADVPAKRKNENKGQEGVVNMSTTHCSLQAVGHLPSPPGHVNAPVILRSKEWKENGKPYLILLSVLYPFC